METTTSSTTPTSAPEKRISKTAQWAMSHRFMIYDVTDPELRSQLCNFRDKREKK